MNVRFAEKTEPMISSHKAHFGEKPGFVPRRREACRPSEHKGLFSEVAELGLSMGLNRSTSSDHFRKVIVPAKRAPFIPPVNKAPYSSADDPGMSVWRPTSADHFRSALQVDAARQYGKWKSNAK